MNKIKTDTVMGEDLQKMFKKLNNTLTKEEAEKLKGQEEMIKNKFEDKVRKKKLKTLLGLALVIIVSVFILI